ncbi:unnamed protein product, partial [Symbiodinium necroappetens]
LSRELHRSSMRFGFFWRRVQTGISGRQVAELLWISHCLRTTGAHTVECWIFCKIEPP